MQHVISQALSNTDMKFLCAALSQDDSDVLLLYDKLLRLLKPLFTNTKPTRSAHILQNDWFDQECRELKLELTKGFRRTRYDKNEASMLKIDRLKAQFKNLIKKKKVEHAKHVRNSNKREK